MKTEYIKTHEDDNWIYSDYFVDGEFCSKSMKLKRLKAVDLFSEEYREYLRKTEEIRAAKAEAYWAGR